MANVKIQSLIDEDDRAGVRYRLLLDASIEHDRDGLTDVVIHDLSATGLLLETKASLPEQSEITIDLPGAGTAVARIVWSSGTFRGGQFSAPLTETAVKVAHRQSKVVWPAFGHAGGPQARGEKALDRTVDDVVQVQQPRNDLIVHTDRLPTGVSIPIMILVSSSLWGGIIVAITRF